MSAIALQRSSHSSPLPPRDVDSHKDDTSTYPSSSFGPSSHVSPSPQRPRNMPSSPPPMQPAGHPASPPREAPRTSPREKSQSGAQPDPNPQTHSNGQDSSRVPQIKEEQPTSPVPSRLAAASTSHSLAAPPAHTRRQRPGMLDLSKDKEIPASQGGMNGRPSAPLTSKDSAGMSSLHDVGLACLSPGFQTRDPSMKSQMARSMEMREQQRQIIEARMGKKDGPGESGGRDGGFARPPGTSRRKGPPPGLSIHAPSAQQFANEPRIVQSAPLHQSFTGLRPTGPGAAHPLSRQVLDRSDQQQHRANSGEASSLAPVQTHQNSHRLPPIQDVFANEHLGSSRRPSDTLSRANSGPQLQLQQQQQQQQRHSPAHPATSQTGPQPSPSFLPPPSSAGLHPPPHASTFPRAESNKSPHDHSRRREFKSAEEAVQTLSGGREELIPKIVHYGGHQPPTPPSPLPPGQQPGTHQAISHHDGRSTSRRRTREEYERDYYEQDDARERERERQRAWEEERGHRAGPFGERPDSPETNRRKKDEFMLLCARAWDLFHS